MENEKLTYINSRGERLELGVDSVYHCNISKDVEGISGVTSVIYSTTALYHVLYGHWDTARNAAQRVWYI